MNRLEQLSRDSVIYGVGGGLSRAIPFFLLPVYTRIFSPTDYGNIEFMTVIVSLITAIIVLGMDSAQSFFFYEQKKEGKVEQAKVVSSILEWRLIWGTLTILISGLTAPILNNIFFDGKLNWIYFAVAFTQGLFSSLMLQSIEILRLLYRPIPYVIIGLLNSLISASLILIFVIIFKQGILGYFIGNLIASAIVAIIGWYIVRDYINLNKLHTSWWGKLLRFGAPLLPAELAYFAMSTMDRWFIKTYHPADELGFYAVGAKFAIIFTLIIETFRKAWWPIAMDSMHSKDGEYTFRLIGKLYVGVGVGCIILINSIVPWLVKWLTAPAYHGVWPIISILFWQSLFYGFYLIGSAGIWKAKKTYITAYLITGAALINLILNYLLVPKYGGIAAAISTVISYLVWIIVTVIISERLWKVNHNFIIISSILVSGIIMSLCSILIKIYFEPKIWFFLMEIGVGSTLLLYTIKTIYKKQFIANKEV